MPDVSTPGTRASSTSSGPSTSGSAVLVPGTADPEASVLAAPGSDTRPHHNRSPRPFSGSSRTS
ncbi:hypothetical protein [Streptomyces sp. NPDC088196]|uniref:hypothetical protein n=1 Tax=Streptomyces sp. NPDC088196 TaxID=3154868 RepID=UPI00344E516F